MPNRKRCYAWIADTFFLQVEQVEDNPPWMGYVFRRPQEFKTGPPEQPIPHTLYWGDAFRARDEAIAKDAAETTVRNRFPEYAHRMERVERFESEASEEDWVAERNRFMVPQNS